MFWSTASAEHLYGLYEYLNKNTSFGLGKKNAVFGTWIHHLYEMPNMWDQKPPYQGRYENYSYCEGYCHRFMPYWVCYVFNTYFDFLCLFNYSQSFMIWRNRHHLYLIRFLILKKLPSLGTYIFEIYRSRAFKRGITRIHKLDFGWDGHSWPLKAIVTMSPDGTNFLYKCL